MKISRLRFRRAQLIPGVGTVNAVVIDPGDDASAELLNCGWVRLVIKKTRILIPPDLIDPSEEDDAVSAGAAAPPARRSRSPGAEGQ